MPFFMISSIQLRSPANVFASNSTAHVCSKFIWTRINKHWSRTRSLPFNRSTRNWRAKTFTSNSPKCSSNFFFFSSATGKERRRTRNVNPPNDERPFFSARLFWRRSSIKVAPRFTAEEITKSSNLCCACVHLFRQRQNREKAKRRMYRGVFLCTQTRLVINRIPTDAKPRDRHCFFDYSTREEEEGNSHTFLDWYCSRLRSLDTLDTFHAEEKQLRRSLFFFSGRRRDSPIEAIEEYNLRENDANMANASLDLSLWNHPYK